MHVYVRHVRGLAQLALKHGVALVPVITFGENDLYEVICDEELPFSKRCFKFLTKKFVIGHQNHMPNFYGRGWEGWLPLRKPITTVVGEPIIVSKLSEPSYDEVQELYEKYGVCLKELYDEYRGRYGYGDVSLIID